MTSPDRSRRLWSTPGESTDTFMDCRGLGLLAGAASAASKQRMRARGRRLPVIAARRGRALFLEGVVADHRSLHRQRCDGCTSRTKAPPVDTDGAAHVRADPDGGDRASRATVALQLGDGQVRARLRADDRQALRRGDTCAPVGGVRLALGPGAHPVKQRSLWRRASSPVRAWEPQVWTSSNKVGRTTAPFRRRGRAGPRLAPPSTECQGLNAPPSANRIS
jgi:hypothetical protein